MAPLSEPFVKQLELLNYGVEPAERGFWAVHEGRPPTSISACATGLLFRATWSLTPHARKNPDDTEELVRELNRRAVLARIFVDDAELVLEAFCAEPNERKAFGRFMHLWLRETQLATLCTPRQAFEFFDAMP